MLEQTVGAVAKAVDWTGVSGRCESLSQLVVELGKLLSSGASNAPGDTKRRFVLVFDGIDKQREPPPTLLSALARLGEVVSYWFPDAVYMLIMVLDTESHHCFHCNSTASQLSTFSWGAAHPFPLIYQAGTSTNLIPHRPVSKIASRCKRDERYLDPFRLCGLGLARKTLRERCALYAFCLPAPLAAIHCPNPRRQPFHLSIWSSPPRKSIVIPG